MQFSTADTIFYCMQGKDSKQQRRQHKKSLLTNLNRPKPSLNRLHHKQLKSQTNGLGACRWPRRQSYYHCPTCKRRRGTTRSRGRLRTLKPLRPSAVSARRHLGSFHQSFLGKARRQCTRERTQSSSANWTDSGRLHMSTATRQKSDSANTCSKGGMRKPGSRACCRGTFHCLTVQHCWLQPEWEESAGERSSASVEDQQQFEYLSK